MRICRVHTIDKVTEMFDLSLKNALLVFDEGGSIS